MIRFQENRGAEMLIGYNTNVTYKGKVYHVQTEDSGLSNPFILTLLYHQGAILNSIKTSYAHLTDRTDFKEQLRDLMKHQHKEMIKTLIAGKHAARTEERKEVVTQPEKEEKKKSGMSDSAMKWGSKSLDEILLEHISRKVKK